MEDAGEGRWCVVTGGRGFAARHLVTMLIRYGMYSVRIADLPAAISLDRDEENGALGDALGRGRAQYVSADLREKSQVLRAIQGAEVVFHMAAPDSSINNHKLHYSVNVQGTKNVVEACIELKVKRLIYTSSPSVVFDGVNGIFNGDESLPYPAKHNDSYSATKAEGEALVLKSNGSNGLLTCCIRPSSIFGPGDKLLVPSLVAAARAGKSKFMIGDGNNTYDFTYVENVAHAHVCAERALASEKTVAERASGQAYFITNMEPIKFWEFVAVILEGLGFERPKIKIPAFVMMPIAYMVEFVYKILAPCGMKVPQLTPSRIRLLSRSRTFNCSKANDYIGYMPTVPLEEGLRRTIESYSHLRAEVQTKREGPSKSQIFLGSGKVADILLWRNKRRTVNVLLILVAFYINFIATGYTIITSASMLLLAIIFFLFIHGKLPQNILGYKIEKVPDSKFHVSEYASHEIALMIASGLNSFLADFRYICRGHDSSLFIKVAVSLLLLSILGTFSARNTFITGVLFAFTAFVVYEKFEEEFDSLLLRLKLNPRDGTKKLKFEEALVINHKMACPMNFHSSGSNISLS